MNFGKELNNYISLLDCSTNEICKVSGISYSLVNRYINNKRIPKCDGKNFKKIVDAIYQISLNKKIELSKESIYETLKIAITTNNLSIDFDLFINNLNKLQDELSITTVEMSKSIGYDPSFISRIKNKERKPADIENFITKVRNYIISISLQNDQKKQKLIKLINYPEKKIDSTDKFKKAFSDWLYSKHLETNSDDVLNFLSKLDTFNLNDYIGSDFSKIKIPTSPIIFQNSKTYLGIKGRKQAEAEFLKTTLLSKSNDPIFYYNDLPLSNLAKDEDFKKKWIYVMTRVLKKGLHLNIVHNLNRPLNELFLGLEGWIPMYMTGSISPYYFKNPPSNFFLGSQFTSGSVALSSECIKFDEKKSKYYLTTKKEEVKYEREKSDYMLSKATPLMDIYKEDDEKSFEKFINKEKNKKIKKIEKDIFKNIDFYVNDNKWVIINKKTHPQIHFVIHHEKLVDAIKSFLIN